MPETAFIVTVDAEGDDMWSRPQEITTRNARFLPRFQALCERHGLRPVYLTNHEMACSDEFVEFGRDVLARGKGEIGMHLHAWNSPPLCSLTGDDFHHQPYLVEYETSLMRGKVRALTRLLEDRFDARMTSHRAGRWALDARYAAILREEGYRVDCSVTPGVDWRANPGAPGGRGGTDYRGYPSRPYYLDARDPARPAAEGLLEVPMTVRPSLLARRAARAYHLPMIGRLARHVAPRLRWLCPVQLHERANVDAMLEVAHAAFAERPDHLEFMLHSSELMPGGSPSFRTPGDIERLYDRLEALFETAARLGVPKTLSEFAARHAARAVAA